jgi:ABC-type phosphate transport system permease subunit
MESKFWTNTKLIASTIGISAIIIAIFVLSVMAIPFVFGIGIMIGVYIVLRILNEDVDVD